MITDRRRAGGWEAVVAAAGAWASRLQMVQVREKDVSTAELLEMTAGLVQRLAPAGVRVVVNGRVDVALAAGAAGLHLPGDAPAPKVFRPLLPAGFWVGVSCHMLDEVRRAEQEGADYAFLSPIFLTASKPGYGPALGVAALEEAARAVRIPVYGLGGVGPEQLSLLAQTGAAGVAAISMFQSK